MPAEQTTSPGQQDPEQVKKSLDVHELEELARHVFELLKKESLLEKERRGWRGGARESH